MKHSPSNPPKSKQHNMDKIIDFSETVSILVGPEERKFEVSKGLICSRPTFFRMCFAIPMSESQTAVIRLPEEDPEIFEICFEWLSRDHPKWIEGIPCNYKVEDEGEGLAWCMVVYRLLHKLHWVEAKNFIVQLVYKLHANGFPNRLYTSGIDEEQLIEGSKLWILLRDIAAHDLHRHGMVTWRTERHRDNFIESDSAFARDCVAEGDRISNQVVWARDGVDPRFGLLPPAPQRLGHFRHFHSVLDYMEVAPATQVAEMTDWMNSEGIKALSK